MRYMVAANADSSSGGATTTSTDSGGASAAACPRESPAHDGRAAMRAHSAINEERGGRRILAMISGAACAQGADGAGRRQRQRQRPMARPEAADGLLAALGWTLVPITSRISSARRIR